MKRRQVDVTVDNHGSIFLFHLHTKDARQWVKDFVDEEAQWFGGALAVECRYAGDLVGGMQGAGLIVE